MAAPSPAGGRGASGTKARYEPGMLELDTALGSDGKWHLLIAGGFHSPQDLPAGRFAVTGAGSTASWKALHVSKQFHDGIATFGGAVVASERGNLEPGFEHDLPVIPGEGTYTLQLELDGQRVDEPVVIGQTRVTNGEVGYVIGSATYEQRAALRFDRDVHGIDIGYPHEPRLWITLRTPLTRETSRADFLWYHGDTFVAQSSHEQNLGGIGLATQFERPIRFWSWPEDLHFEGQVKSRDGTWKVYVYQDGIYRTACTFEVARGDIAGRARSSAQLPCKKLETPMDVKRRGALLELHPEMPTREKELVALYKSAPTRDQLRELIEHRRSQSDAMTARGMASMDIDKALTDTEARRAQERYRGAEARARAEAALIDKLNRRYVELIARYGTE